VSGQLHAPAALPPGKEPPVPIGRKMGGPQCRSERRGENTLSYLGSNSNPSLVQPVANHYTDYAIPVTHLVVIHICCIILRLPGAENKQTNATYRFEATSTCKGLFVLDRILKYSRRTRYSKYLNRTQHQPLRFQASKIPRRPHCALVRIHCHSLGRNADEPVLTHLFISLNVSHEGMLLRYHIRQAFHIVSFGLKKCVS
jgi:hypothetical protein